MRAGPTTPIRGCTRDNSYRQRWSVKSMETFGSSLVFVWLRLWHWFGYSLVTLQEFGLSKWLPSMPLVVRGWAASLRAILHFGIETTREEYQKCISVRLLSASVGLGDEVRGHHRSGVWLSDAPRGVCRWLTALRVGVQHRNDRGQESEGGVTGSWDTYWHLRGPTIS